MKKNHRQSNPYPPERVGCIVCKRKFYIDGSDVYLLLDDRRQCKTCIILQEIALDLTDEEAYEILKGDLAI